MGLGSGIAMSCDVGHRRSSDLVLLWLWRRPVTAAEIQSLAWEPPHATGAALKGQTTKKKKKKKEKKKDRKEGIKNKKKKKKNKAKQTEKKKKKKRKEKRKKKKKGA